MAWAGAKLRFGLGMKVLLFDYSMGIYCNDMAFNNQ